MVAGKIVISDFELRRKRWGMGWTPERMKIASGYERMVYGDHGPYFEFRPDQIMWGNFPKEVKKSKHAYYDEAYSANRSIKLYLQKKTVEDRPNPPAGIWSTRNYRKGGYADYKLGMVYMAAYEANERPVVEAKPDGYGSRTFKWAERPPQGENDGPTETTERAQEPEGAFSTAARPETGTAGKFSLPRSPDNGKLCIKGHAMKTTRAEAEYTCDAWGVDIEVDEELLDCRKCNLSLCSTCQLDMKTAITQAKINGGRKSSTLFATASRHGKRKRLGKRTRGMAREEDGGTQIGSSCQARRKP